ncbi:MAG: FAD binding domain-containing protein [Actinomycetota bacterium]|nr:FAD binding domain-containing protein [Actinomycetota bacterium]
MDLPGITEVAAARLGSWRPGDAWLAGGTWLFSEPQPALTRLLDLRAFGWPALRVSQAGLEIAATCTLAELARLQVPQWRAAPLIGQCCAALLGSFKVWNEATVGGNLCLALPAGPMISLTAALEGQCVIWSPDGAPRRVPVADFVTGPGRCVLRPGELLRSVQLPATALNGTTAFRQLSLSPVGRSAALVIGRRSAAGTLVLTVTAATTRPVQLRFATTPAPDQLQASLAAAAPPYYDDVHGSPAWREAITGYLAREVLDELTPA